LGRDRHAGAAAAVIPGAAHGDHRANAHAAAHDYPGTDLDSDSDPAEEALR